jgi:hypothetical protein
MQKTKFGFLSNHFHYYQFEIIPGSEFHNQVKKQYQDNYGDYKYGICLIENETKSILDICCLTNDDTSDFSSFHFYLNQLPNLDLNSIALLLALISNTHSRLTNNFFQIPHNYPSQFAKIFLKDTFGQVVFTFQFMQLLSFCLPQSENSHNQINEYRRLYNLRQADFFKKLEGLYLPDGYSLYKLLKTYTPYHSMPNNFGFLTRPTHKLAYEFIEKAKKYINL